VHKELILATCRHLLTPVVRLLLKSGITWREFADLGRGLFVDIARRDYGIQGRATNIARVALMTGLGRREVMRIRDQLEHGAVAEPAPRSRISQVLSGWHLDPEFLDSAGRPAVLPQAGERGSLAALLKRYAGDMPHGAIAKELLQLNLMADTGSGYRPLARDYVRDTADPDIVRQLGVALHDHGVTLLHNVSREPEEPSRFESMATTPRLAPRHARAFAELAAARGKAFLEEMDAWLVKHEVRNGNADSAADATGVRMGIGVYLIQDTARRGRRK
jgi:hypothetical protein